MELFLSYLASTVAIYSVQIRQVTDVSLGIPLYLTNKDTVVPWLTWALLFPPNVFLPYHEK